MKVYLLNPKDIRPDVSEHQQACYSEILECASQDMHARHQLVSDPESADMVLAPIQGDGFGPFFGALRHSSFFRRYEVKVIGYCPDDLIYPTVPGIYPSISRWWAERGWGCGGHYVSSHIHQHRFEPLPGEQRDILFSFVGSSKTHSLRERIMHVEHPRAVFIDSTSKDAGEYWFQKDEQFRQTMFDQYRDVISRTKFALCPRGISGSSIRLFEAMESGCVPVIIADSLVLPPGPDWKSFSLRVGEQDVSLVPTLIDELESKFEQMSSQSRATWENFFSPRSTFHQLGEWSNSILRGLSPVRRKWLKVLAQTGQYCIPNNIRVKLRHALRNKRGALSHQR